MASGSGEARRSMLERMQEAADADERRFLAKMQAQEQAAMEGNRLRSEGGVPEDKRVV